MSALKHSEGNSELWHQIFAVGHPVLAKKQARYGRLPGQPRCKLCDAPMGGLGGWLVRLTGLHQSERNKNFCNACDSFMKAFPGGAEVDMSMMMVDVRNSVELSSRLSPSEFARTVLAMRSAVSDALARTDGFVLEYQGDSVFAVWPPGFVGSDHARKALAATDLVLARLQQLPKAAPVGIGVHTGRAYIGTASTNDGDMLSISAFGLDVNLLARVTHAAQQGEALATPEVFRYAGRVPGSLSTRTLELKGITDRTPVITIGPLTAKPSQEAKATETDAG
ncbi:adenylate/guanylate cyclase domain-containing protein [Defluviimonas sp. D31]|uniref:adenylate/guanylate cyclase domain-containing protein n=1 Tax=Defluviimonas sp. D31 TaxID=3083253 RepID=UPI00296EDDCC|nr:adenylate/guanylate cyclase domain-containing protein [Defluviimonas sp. D31]MDW4551219.1 adenylate/guanylate cyclase domain-containing protein [Defluviimonas sp. D31]